MRYFWWAEFQERGALHYHAIIVDAPFADEGAARRWFTDNWRAQLPAGVFRAQPDTKFRAAAWFRKSAGDYVLKDVRKLGGKHYQQNYSRMPRGWRTFRSHQLTFEAAEHQEHDDKHVVRVTVHEATKDAPRRTDILLVARDCHVPARGGCKLFRRKPPRRRSVALVQNDTPRSTPRREHLTGMVILGNGRFRKEPGRALAPAIDRRRVSTSAGSVPAGVDNSRLGVEHPV
jgi:hypothetical protein